MRGIAAVFAATLLFGCQPLVLIQPDAFTRERSVALVMLHAESDISEELYTRDKRFDARSAMLATHPIVLEGLERNRYFRMVPEAKVLSTPTYARASNGFMSSCCVMPPGYKFINSEAPYSQIAREAGADIGLALGTYLKYMPDGRGVVILAVTAIEATGRRLWKGSARAEADDATDIRKASEARRAEIYKATMRKALAALEKNMTDELAEARAAPTPAR